MILCATRDKVSGLTSNPSVFHNKDMFVREIVTFIKTSPEAMIAQRPEDFQLIVISDYNSKNEQPISLENFEVIELSDIVGGKNG